MHVTLIDAYMLKFSCPGCQKKKLLNLKLLSYGKCRPRLVASRVVTPSPMFQGLAPLTLQGYIDLYVVFQISKNRRGRPCVQFSSEEDGFSQGRIIGIAGSHVTNTVPHNNWSTLTAYNIKNGPSKTYTLPGDRSYVINGRGLSLWGGNDFYMTGRWRYHAQLVYLERALTPSGSPWLQAVKSLRHATMHACPRSITSTSSVCYLQPL